MRAMGREPQNSQSPKPKVFSNARVKKWLHQVLKSAYLLELIALELAYDGKIVLAYAVMEQAKKLAMLVERIEAELEG